MKMKLENKVAVVTGGAMGNGLGIVEVLKNLRMLAMKLKDI